MIGAPPRLGAETEPSRQVVELPALAIVIAHMSKRPAWQGDRPFEVPGELYEAARTEMQVHMRRRGFPLPVDKNLERDGVTHFLYLGTPITAKAE